MIYKAKYILPMGGSIIEDGEVLVRDGAIEAVGTSLTESYPAESIKDMGTAALLPGFVNAHSHIDYTLNRNAYDGLNLWDWIDKVGFRKGKKPDYEVILASAVMGAAECARSGITCLGDSSFSGAAATAMDLLSIRGIVYREVFGQSMGDKYEEEYAKILDTVAEMQSETSNRLTIGISPHTVYTSNKEVLKLCADSCANLNIPIAFHLAETEAELQYLLNGTGPLANWRKKLGYEPMANGLTPAKYLYEVGMLRKGVCLAHCVHLSDDEIEIIASSGASAAHCPRSNAYLGTGVAPVLQLESMGTPVGLGTDSAASCLRMDFFEEMRFMAGIHRAMTKDAAAVTAKHALELATIGGARALGLEEQIGSLETGKRADMMAVDLSGMLHGEDLFLAVMSRTPTDVLFTMVEGIEIVNSGIVASVDVNAYEKVVRSALEQQRIG